MPYADPEKRKAIKRASYAKRLRDPFTGYLEKLRKAKWQETPEGKESNRLRQARYRARKKEASAPRD